MEKENPSNRAAFTLVELLVVLGIIVVLLSILLPAVSKARRVAGQAACASNLRQWAQAAHLYANLNAGFLPRRGQGTQPTTQIDAADAWFNVLPAVLDQPGYSQLAKQGRKPDFGIWVCPQVGDIASGFSFTFGMNMWMGTTIAIVPDKLTDLGDLSTMVFMADAPPNHCSVVPGNASYSPDARHEKRVNVCFMDGHVAAYTGESLGCGTTDPRRPDVRWEVPGSPWPGPK